LFVAIVEAGGVSRDTVRGEVVNTGDKSGRIWETAKANPERGFRQWGLIKELVVRQGKVNGRLLGIGSHLAEMVDHSRKDNGGGALRVIVAAKRRVVLGKF